MDRQGWLPQPCLGTPWSLGVPTARAALASLPHPSHVSLFLSFSRSTSLRTSFQFTERRSCRLQTSSPPTSLRLSKSFESAGAVRPTPHPRGESDRDPAGESQSAGQGAASPPERQGGHWSSAAVGSRFPPTPCGHAGPRAARASGDRSGQRRCGKAGGARA